MLKLEYSGKTRSIWWHWLCGPFSSIKKDFNHVYYFSVSLQCRKITEKEVLLYFLFPEVNSMWQGINLYLMCVDWSQYCIILDCLLIWTKRNIFLKYTVTETLPRTSYLCISYGRVMHICISKLTITGSDNGLTPGRHQAIIWIHAGLLWTGPLGINFSEILTKTKNNFIKKCA